MNPGITIKEVEFSEELKGDIHRRVKSWLVADAQRTDTYGQERQYILIDMVNNTKLAEDVAAEFDLYAGDDIVEGLDDLVQDAVDDVEQDAVLAEESAWNELCQLIDEEPTNIDEQKSLYTEWARVLEQYNWVQYNDERDIDTARLSDLSNWYRREVLRGR